MSGDNETPAVPDAKPSDSDRTSTSGSASAPEARASSDRSGVPTEFAADRILFHGSGLLVVDKPAGVSVRGDDHDVGLAEHIALWASVHPGQLDLKTGNPILAVQLLEREASGVTLFALHRPMARIVQEAMDAQIITRTVLTVVAGPMDPVGQIRGKVRSKVGGTYRRVDAELSYKRICGDERLSLLAVTPGKSRRHLVRALFANESRPLAGDARYGRPKPAKQFLEKFGLPGPVLHELETELPPGILGARRILRAPLPDHLVQLATAKEWIESPGFRDLVTPPAED